MTLCSADAAALQRLEDPLIGQTLAGKYRIEKLIKTGGMVVKNVAGLDMGKMMIGSFGTLAAITSVNFRVHALPEAVELLDKRS